MAIYKSALFSALALSLAGCQLEPVNKQLFLAGGHLTVCSSMTQDDCVDWDQVRNTVFSDVPDSEIRTPINEPVSVDISYSTRVLNTRSWADEPEWQQALTSVLTELRNQNPTQTYQSWSDFKTAFIGVDAEAVGVTIDSSAVDGDYLWYNSSSDQWDALHYLKMDDGLVTYSINAHKLGLALLVDEQNPALTNAINALAIDSQYRYIDLVNALSPEFNSLTVEQQYRLLRVLRDEIEYQRPTEYVSFDDSRSTDSIAAYKKFVSLAADNNKRDERPTVLVMTSSSNNNYDVADFYVSLFEQAGANAIWLPIDRAYRQAVDKDRCEDLQLYHDVYAGKPHQDLYFPDYAATKQQACENPAQLQALIEQADGLFINGGSQTRSLESLITDTVDSEEMRLIRQRYQEGALLVGGSSAGTAVLTGGRLEPNSPVNPMIDGGTNYDVLVSGYSNGVYNENGGLGLFNWGVTDTHFSERARETRLIALLQQQGTRFGFGVDETTALVVKQPVDSADDIAVKMSVVGAAGVYIVDIKGSHVAGVAPLEMHDIKTHYLTEGDTLELDPETLEYQIRFAESKTMVEQDSAVAQPFEGDLLYSKRDNYRALLNDMIALGASSAEGESYEYDPYYVVEFSRSEETQGVVDSDEKASYQSVMVSLTPYY